MSQLYSIVMAAGHGTRMKSSTSKVLHEVCGRPLVYFPIRAALDAGASRVVVVVNPQNEGAVARALAQHGLSETCQLAVQQVPCGTGDAAKVGLRVLQGTADDRVLVQNGDVPLVSPQRLSMLAESIADAQVLAFLSFIAPDPTGYGRVLRDQQGNPTEVREHRDLVSSEHKAVNEVNGGLYAGRYAVLEKALAGLSCDNAQGEYYITDVVSQVAGDSADSALARVGVIVASAEELAGVNDRSQLNSVERALFARIRDRLGQEGVSIVGEPLIDDTVCVQADARIEDGVRLRGSTSVGAGTLVDVGSVVTDCVVESEVNIKPHCVLLESHVGSRVQLGPFAHLRPGSVLEADCHVGNFVETKKTLVKRGAKANHLAYLGDAEVGEGANLGAGVIVCNYDGFQKQRTVIGAGAFIGSDSQLVAPVSVGAGAYVATGTSVTRDVPADGLAIGRVRQSNKEGYAAQLRTRLAAEAAAKKSSR